MVWQILGAYQIAISFFIMFMYLLHQGRLDRLWVLEWDLTMHYQTHEHDHWMAECWCIFPLNSTEKPSIVSRVIQWK